MFTRILEKLALPPRVFLALCIVAVIATRALVILVTPRTADLPDLRIYQAAGQAVLAGVNPYDFDDHPQERVAMQTAAAKDGPMAFYARTIEEWNYYVSSNLPASTALYTVNEFIADGSRPVWRWLFILGDLAILLGLVAMLRAIRVEMGDPIAQIGIVVLVVLNPVLIVSGCAIPEDKQFQTALLLFASALLLSAPATIGKQITTGLTLSLAVLFKFFGAFLAPLWLAVAYRKGWRFTGWSLVAGALPLAISLGVFGTHFIATMGARAVTDSVQGPEHASPWTLIPMSGTSLLVLKIAVVAAFCATILWLLLRKRIDLLNSCAALTIAFACLWLDKGAMNRMNIAIMFATAALASLSVPLFCSFALGFAALAGAAYVLGIGVLHLELIQVDALLVAAFVVAYWLAMTKRGFLKSSIDSLPTAAAGESRA